MPATDSRRLDEARRILSTLAAMAGWRLERLTPAWVALGAGSLALGHLVRQSPEAWVKVGFYLWTLALYYVGNTLLLASDLPARAVAAWGEERAWARYEQLLALMFIHQGLGVGALEGVPLPSGALGHAPPWVVIGLGALLMAMGLIVKVWATLLVGVDIYYYKDLFLRRPLAPLVQRGPYALFTNPMYSVGQLPAFGYALMARSPGALLAALIGTAGIYAFYAVVERPFVEALRRGEREGGIAEPR